MSDVTTIVGEDRFPNSLRRLLIWSAIIGAFLTILAVTGLLHTQGDGFPTSYEWGIVGSVVLIWIVARFLFHTDFSEEYLLGFIFGVQWEFLTEPYWTYLPGKFNILAWKDVPIMALVGWCSAFALTLHLSEWLGKKIFQLSGLRLIFDWRILICDAVAIQIVGVSAEWLCGVLLKCWTYNVDFGLGKSPIGLGWELHIGYVIVMFWYGTTLRVWKSKLEGRI